MTPSSLSPERQQQAALRGLAILGIVLHNYCHFLNFAVKENEYTFNAERPAAMLEKILSLDGDLFIHLFSFFGHYGVPVFLFLSGYGLVKKYEQQITTPSEPSKASSFPALRFCGYHFTKLFRLMIIGYLAFIAVYLLRHNDGAKVYSWDHVLTQLTMIINLCYENPSGAIKPGPYWFFGLMLQLYVIYALLLRRFRSELLLWSIVLVSIIIELALESRPDLLNYVRYNFVGSLLPFCMGLSWARHERSLDKRIWLLVLVVSAVFVAAGSMTYASWTLVPAFVVTGAVATVKLTPTRWLGTFVWTGGISAFLFVMHPLAREVIIPHYRRFDIYGGIAIYLLTSVSLALLLQYILRHIPAPKWK